ncbi:MAG: hypothetical protein Q8P88_02605 [Candidatus Jorgensenbacteria bacterium]|nr:hypothetical protein [Candidatus Jorgensenbacteria bacterium]
MKVLIIEREESYRAIFEAQLRDLGFEVLFGITADEGRRLFHEHSASLFAVSVGSKIEGNLELVREMRAIHPHPFPIIATSAIPEFREALKKAGCNREVNDKTLLLDELLVLEDAHL